MNMKSVKGVHQGTLCGTELIIHFVADLHTNAKKSAIFMTPLFVEICAKREHLKLKNSLKIYTS